MLFRSEKGSEPDSEPHAVETPAPTVSQPSVVVDLPAPNVSQPPTRPTRTIKASQKVRDLQAGVGTHTIRVTRSTKALPSGVQAPTQKASPVQETGNASAPQLEEEIDGVAMSAEMSTSHGMEPRDVEEARRSPDWPRWKEAIEEELNALKEYGTWRVEKAPDGVNIVGCRWVFRVKRDAEGKIVRYKDRKSTRLNSSHSGESRMPSSA